MKKGYVYVWGDGACNNVSVLCVCFFNMIINAIIFLVLRGVVRVFSDLQLYFLKVILNVTIF